MMTLKRGGVSKEGEGSVKRGGVSKEGEGYHILFCNFISIYLWRNIYFDLILRP